MKLWSSSWIMSYYILGHLVQSLTIQPKSNLHNSAHFQTSFVRWARLTSRCLCKQALSLERFHHLPQHPRLHLHLPLQLLQEGRQDGDLWNRGNDAPEHKEPFEGSNFKPRQPHAQIQCKIKKICYTSVAPWSSLFRADGSSTRGFRW